MIRHPIFILGVLLIVEVVLLNLTRLSLFRKLFDVVPVIFFLFASGMLLSNSGFLAHGHPIYQRTIDYMLPLALFLMLVTVDVRSILHLGPAALAVFVAGTVGVMVGMVAAFVMLKPVLGLEFAGGFGALTGSWTGGSANMIAVKEALSIPNHVFTLMVIIDSTVPYVWMGFLIFLCPYQHRLDRYHAAQQFKNVDVQQGGSLVKWPIVGTMIALGLCLSIVLNYVDAFVPVIPGVLSAFTWTIIFVTAIALSLGATPLGQWAKQGIGPWGQWVLFFVLLCIGAKGDLSQINRAPWLFLAAAIALCFHAAFVYAMGRLVKAPFFIMSVASQANLGGVASASMLAEIYRPGFASVGLLMAILGNIIGTYAGIIVGQICRLLG